MEDKKKLAAILGALAYLLEEKKPKTSPWVKFVRSQWGLLRDPKTWGQIGGRRWS